MHFSLIMYIFLALLLCGLLATLAYLLSLSTSQDIEKRSEYECGFAPFDSATRLPFDVHFYLVGILFLIFDVEVALLFPWTIALSSLSWYAFFSMASFVAVLTIGFIYEWKRGALIWPSRQRVRHVLLVGLFSDTEFSFVPSGNSTLTSFSSEIILALGVCVALLVAVYGFWKVTSTNEKQNHKFTVKDATTWIWNTIGATLCTAFVATFLNLLFVQPQLLLNGYFYTNHYVVAMKLLVLFCSLFALGRAFGFTEIARDARELPIVFCLAVVFLLLLVGSNHLLSAFLSLAGFSLNMYVLILYYAPLAAAREAGIKYYYLSTLSTGLILYGMFLLYATTGSGQFYDIDAALAGASNGATLHAFGVLMIFVGFMFKLSAFPGHLWAADVYEGSPAFVTIFFMIPVKVAILAFFIRFLTTALPSLAHLWQPWLVLVSVVSMVWGAFAAYNARSTRRFLAFTSINQMGFLLIGPACNTMEGYRATLVYLVIYALTSLCFLSLVVREHGVEDGMFFYLTDFNKIDTVTGYEKWTITIALFSMAGIPPLGGFFGKYYLLLHTVEQGLYFVTIVALATSLLSTYYYLRAIKLMWFESFTWENFEIGTVVAIYNGVTQAILASLCAFAFIAPGMLAYFTAVSASLFIGAATGPL